MWQLASFLQVVKAFTIGTNSFAEATIINCSTHIHIVFLGIFSLLEWLIPFGHRENIKNHHVAVQSIQLCLTLCNPMDCCMPGFPVLHYLLEFAQIHVHWVNNAIQPSHPLLPSSPPALSLSQHQGLFQRVSSLHQVPTSS